MFLLVRVVVLLLLASRPSHADPSERSDRDRVWHIVPVVLGGASYLVVEFALKQQIRRAGCWWCEPPGLDARARSLNWSNVDRAHSISNVTGFVISPLFAMGGLAASTAFTDRDGRRVYDRRPSRRRRGAAQRGAQDRDRAAAAVRALQRT